MDIKGKYDERVAFVSYLAWIRFAKRLFLEPVYSQSGHTFVPFGYRDEYSLLSFCFHLDSACSTYLTA